jgi:hypothetical protein
VPPGITVSPLLALASSSSLNCWLEDMFSCVLSQRRHTTFTKKVVALRVERYNGDARIQIPQYINIGVRNQLLDWVTGGGWCGKRGGDSMRHLGNEEPGEWHESYSWVKGPTFWHVLDL